MANTEQQAVNRTVERKRLLMTMVLFDENVWLLYDEGLAAGYARLVNGLHKI